LARVIIGGVLCAMFFSIWIFPLFFQRAYRKFDPQHIDDENENLR
jgi:heavy metal efflux system protein